MQWRYGEEDLWNGIHLWDWEFADWNEMYGWGFVDRKYLKGWECAWESDVGVGIL